MKTIILLFTLLLAAGQVMAQPTIIMKVGGWPGSETSQSAGNTHGFIMALESTACGRHCFNPFFTRQKTDYGTHDGLGIDYTYKIAYRPGRDALRLSVGIVGFEDPLNYGEAANFHLGAGFEVYSGHGTSYILSIDHFSNGAKLLNRSEVDNNLPVNMLSLGIRFY